MSVSIVTDFSFSLEVEHVLRGQGVDPDRARPRLFETARDVLDEARSLLAPAALYMTLPVREFKDQQVTLDISAVSDGSAIFEGPLVARALMGATEVALAVCTVGSALDERTSALFAEEPVRAMALDGAGIGAVELIARLIGERVRDEAEARGLRIGMRAEPGQEGWEIWQQRVLFGLLPAAEIGVQLTDSCLMLPRKSLSFVVGLGPQMRPDAVTCDFCSKRERCQWRSHSDS